MATTTDPATLECEASWLPPPEASRIEKAPRELGSVGEIVTCMTAHPTNDLLLLGTVTGNVVVWDPAQAAMTQCFQAHTKDVTRIVFAPESERFLTVSIDGWVHWWDYRFQRQQGMSAGVPLFSAAISPTGRELAAGGQDGKLRVWDTVTGVLLHVLEGQSDAISACVWLRPGLVIAGGSDGNMRVWEVDARRCIRQHKGHAAHISQLLRGPSGNWYLTASWDQTVKVWNTHHRERFAFPAGNRAVTSIVMTDDGRLLAASYWDGSVRVWDVDTGKVKEEFQAHEECLIGCSLVAGSRFLVTADQEGRLRSWSVDEMGTVRYINQHSGEVYSVRYTPDNLHVLSAAYDGIVRVWDRNERLERSLLELHLGPTTATAISPDNGCWAIGAADGSIRLWDAKEQALDANLPGHKQTVSDLVFLPGGDMLVSAAWDMKLKLWSMKTQSLECVYDGHTGAVSACDVSLDGRILASASWDGTGRIWDLVHRRRDIGMEKKILAGHTERLLCCAISPDGRFVATGAADQTVRIWPIEKKGEPRILFGHPAPVTACRYTPDGRLLVSADREGRLFFWDAMEGKTLGTIAHKAPVLSLAIAPDGSQAVVGDDQGRLRFLDLQYPRGPKWIAAAAYLKEPPLWKRGAPPIALYEVGCVYCGHLEQVKEENLGQPWQCRQCGEVLQLCPNSLPPIALS